MTEQLIKLQENEKNSIQQQGIGYDKRDHMKSGIYAGLESKDLNVKLLEGIQEQVVQESDYERKRRITLQFLQEKI